MLGVWRKNAKDMIIVPGSVPGILAAGFNLIGRRCFLTKKQSLFIRFFLSLNHVHNNSIYAKFTLRVPTRAILI